MAGIGDINYVKEKISSIQTPFEAMTLINHYDHKSSFLLKNTKLGDFIEDLIPSNDYLNKRAAELYLKNVNANKIPYIRMFSS